MRVFIAFVFLVFSLGLQADDTKERIKTTMQDISQSSKKETDIKKKLDELGEDLLKSKAEKDKIDKELNSLQNSLDLLKDDHEKAIKEFDTLTKTNKELLSKQRKLEDDIADLFANKFAFDEIELESSDKTIQSIISNEIFIAINSMKKDRILSMSKQYSSLSKDIGKVSDQILALKASIDDHRAKEAKVKEAKKAKEQALLKLNKSKNDYISKLETIQKEKEALRKTLSELKILSEQNIQKQAQKPSKEQEEVSDLKDERVKNIKQKVKQYGSSYYAGEVKKYNGTKTISPLKNAKIKTKFGKYKDPVYDMELFSESIVLTSAKQNAQIVSVLPGKIVYAQDTMVLGKVVIIEHSNEMHTIYGHLTQIPSEIKVGKIIKKGYTIGRIKQDLTFEVTWKKYHINPLDLIVL